MAGGRRSFQRLLARLSERTPRLAVTSFGVPTKLIDVEPG